MKKMMTGVMLVALTGFGAVYTGGAAAMLAAVPAKTVWMNEDNQHFYDGKYHGDEDMTVEGCRALVDRYADTGVCTGVLFCVNMQRALYDSDVWERFKDQPTDYSYQRHLRLLSDRGVDQFKVWLERCRERGLSGWLTMRMNDAHGLEEVAFNLPLPAHLTVTLWPTEMWRKHPEWRRASYRHEHSWESAYDFRHPEVREHHLRLVREILLKWDMDGLELDWMRWGMYFAPGQEAEGRPLLTAFVKEVRRLADEAAKRLGHPVRLGHRLYPDPTTALKAGFDVAAWSDAGCVDRLTVADFGNGTPNDIPLELWRRIVRPGTEIICGLSYGGAESAPYNSVSSWEVKRGNAASAWACGADGVVLFNECYAEPQRMDELARYMRDISSPAALARAGWRSVVKSEDSYPGYAPRCVFPAKLAQRFTGHGLNRMGHFLTLRLTTGEVSKDASVRLSLAFTKETARETVKDLEVRVNTKPARFVRFVDVDPNRIDPTKSWVKCADFPRDTALVAEYAVPAEALAPRDNAIEVIPPLAKTAARSAVPPPGELIWADMAIEGKHVRPLPGEDGTKAALSPFPFPDRMSAYVWRNWGLVDKGRLAEVVGARAEDLTAVAVQMGLEPEPAVLPEWKRRGYITIIRRNWHLLPYDQLLRLLDVTRDELYFSLMEDDFLWVKLGSVKPKCEVLRWSAGMREEGQGKRERIAAILKEEGLDPRASEEPRFTFVQDISAVDPGFKPPVKDASPYDFRLIFSYFADYGDPLGDPEIGSFPEGLLQKLATQGVNAVWLHTVLRTLVKDPKYPEFGEGCERRLANLQKLVDRCRKYGIRVFLYMNEPRGQSPEFFKVPGREGLAGATHGLLQAMCTLNPETQRWLSDSLEKVFSTVHGIGGIFTITASENLTNCAMGEKTKETCPVCRTHTRAEIIATANNAMIRGMRKGDPNAEALVWNWAWPKDEEADIVARLPKEGCRLMAVSENAMPICRGGVQERENDYSLSIVGPGENARRFWGLARAHGIPSVAKVQAANSWELSSFPYLPVMDLVAEHACNVANEGVNGVMLSWSLGCCPSPNLSVYSELRKGERDKEGVLNRLAARLYGDKAAQARKAWTAFSEGFVHYPFSCQTIYLGPQQWGPANPLYPKDTGYSATMVGMPYDDLDGWRNKYPRETYVELIGKVADGFAEGCRQMEGVAGKREFDMFRAEQMHFASCRDQARFVMARDAGDAAGMRKYAKAELERAKAYWPLVRADSRIGFESSNHYFFVPRDVLEKVLSCRAVLDGTPLRKLWGMPPLGR